MRLIDNFTPPTQQIPKWNNILVMFITHEHKALLKNLCLSFHAAVVRVPALQAMHLYNCWGPRDQVEVFLKSLFSPPIAFISFHFLTTLMRRPLNILFLQFGMVDVSSALTSRVFYSLTSTSVNSSYQFCGLLFWHLLIVFESVSVWNTLCMLV